MRFNNTICVKLFAIVLFFNACYSFKGISIPADVDSFYVDNFNLKAYKAPIDFNQQFAESLRDKIRNESSLSYEENNPDITFSGDISYYEITSIPSQENNTTALNRLEIKVLVIFENENDKDKNWKSSFSFFEDFDANTDLITIQDDLLENITDQLTENIFNKAFTDW